MSETPGKQSAIPARRQGELAQLARALDLHSRGHRFDSDILHKGGNSGGVEESGLGKR